MAFAIITLLTVFIGCSKPNGAQHPKQVFNELAPKDAARLEKQRQVVEAAAKQRYGTTALTKSKADLPVLQRLLDDRVFTTNQTYELQCLGVAFGDVLASELPLRWTMVTDQFGTDPTLRYRDTTIQVSALTMISKRVERGESVDLNGLLAGTRKAIADLEKKFQK